MTYDFLNHAPIGKEPNRSVRAYITAIVVMVVTLAVFVSPGSYEHAYGSLTRTGLAQVGVLHAAEDGALSLQEWVPCDVWTYEGLDSAQEHISMIVQDDLRMLEQHLLNVEVAHASGAYESAFRSAQWADWHYSSLDASITGSQAECGLQPAIMQTSDGVDKKARLDQVWWNQFTNFANVAFGADSLPISSGQISTWNQFAEIVGAQSVDDSETELNLQNNN